MFSVEMTVDMSNWGASLR